MVVWDRVHSSREDALDVGFVLVGQEVHPVVATFLTLALELLVEVVQPQKITHFLEFVVLAAEEADLAFFDAAVPDD